jgi:hypothetical protein
MIKKIKKGENKERGSRRKEEEGRTNPQDRC